MFDLTHQVVTYNGIHYSVLALSGSGHNLDTFGTCDSKGFADVDWSNLSYECSYFAFLNDEVRKKFKGQILKVASNTDPNNGIYVGAIYPKRTKDMIVQFPTGDFSI